VITENIKNDLNERTNEFRRNQRLTDLLNEINSELEPVEKELMEGQKLEYPVIFIVGALRSGTTLLTQWLANSGSFSYPSNLLSRFYKAPIMGAKLQLLLTDEKYNFRDELKDLKTNVNYESENGKTKGVLAPNEFWFFWQKFFNLEGDDFITKDKLKSKLDARKAIQEEIAGMMNVFKKPMVFKAMNFNYHLDYLDSLFDKAIFIHIEREGLTNIESALVARKKQMGSIDKWYSFKIPEYEKLVKLNPYEQVAGQIYYINKAIEEGLSKIDKNKKVKIKYEDFCENPKGLFEEIHYKLKLNGFIIDKLYTQELKFNISRKKTISNDIIEAYNKFNKIK